LWAATAAAVSLGLNEVKLQQLPSPPPSHYYAGAVRQPWQSLVASMVVTLAALASLTIEEWLALFALLFDCRQMSLESPNWLTTRLVSSLRALWQAHF
jgi:hypothetical protein